MLEINYIYWIILTKIERVSERMFFWYQLTRVVLDNGPLNWLLM